MGYPYRATKYAVQTKFGDIDLVLDIETDVELGKSFLFLLQNTPGSGWAILSDFSRLIEHELNEENMARHGGVQGFIRYFLDLCNTLLQKLFGSTAPVSIQDQVGQAMLDCVAWDLSSGIPQLRM